MDTNTRPRCRIAEALENDRFPRMQQGSRPSPEFGTDYGMRLPRCKMGACRRIKKGNRLFVGSVTD